MSNGPKLLPQTSQSQKRVVVSYIDIDEMTALDMTRQALQVQDKTQESTSRAKKALEETIQVAKNNSDWNKC